MKKDEHLKNQVLYITNPAYDALHSENGLEESQEQNSREHTCQLDTEE
jgi:hypothetical protein